MFGHGFFGFGGPFVMIIFWMALLFGMVYLARLIPWGNSCGTEARELSPLEILDKRYAAGEVDRDEYDRIKKDLIS